MNRIVICDDEPTIRKGLYRMLEEDGENRFSVVGTASNGMEACDIISKEMPGVVLMDINMPGKTGLEVIEQTRKQLPHTQFIIISGYNEFQYAQRALQLGASDYLLKPIEQQCLFQAVENAMEKYRKAAGEQGVPVQPDHGLAQQAIRCIRERYADSGLTLAVLAQELHVSESYLTRSIKKESGSSFTELLTDLRIAKAKELLLFREELLSQEIAEKTGYQNRHYFCRIFKQITGVSPLKYRELHLQVAQEDTDQ